MAMQMALSQDDAELPDSASQQPNDANSTALRGMPPCKCGGSRGCPCPSAPPPVDDAEMTDTAAREGAPETPARPPRLLRSPLPPRKAVAASRLAIRKAAPAVSLRQDRHLPPQQASLSGVSAQETLCLSQRFFTHLGQTEFPRVIRGGVNCTCSLATPASLQTCAPLNLGLIKCLECCCAYMYNTCAVIERPMFVDGHIGLAYAWMSTSPDVLRDDTIPDMKGVRAAFLSVVWGRNGACRSTISGLTSQSIFGPEERGRFIAATKEAMAPVFAFFKENYYPAAESLAQAMQHLAPAIEARNSRLR